MRASRHFRSVVCACLLAAIMAVPVHGQDVLDLIPAESLVVIRVNQVDNTLSNLDKFLAGLAPAPVQGVIRAQLGQALGSPALNGVDMNGTFAAFAVVPQDAPGAAPFPPVYPGVLIPVSDYDKFISANPNCGASDGNGISAITGPGNRDEDTPWLIATKTGSHALVTMGKLYPQVLQYQEGMGINTAASASMPTMAGVLASEDTKAAKQSPVWMHIDVATASKMFKPFVDGGFSMFKGMVAQKMAEDMKDQGPPMDIGMILDMYGAMLDMIMTQTQSVSLGIDPKPDVIRFSETISAVPGSDLAGMLVKDTDGTPNPLIGFAEDGAAMNMVGHIGESWKHMYASSIELASVMMGGKLTDENAANMKKMIAKMIDVLDGPLVFTFSVDPSAKPLFDMKYVVAVKDGDRFKDLLKESTELFIESGMFDLYKGMGIDMDYSVEYGTSTYKGVSIDSARMAMKSTQPDSPVGKMLDGMYGGGFDYRWAVVDDIYAMAVGGNVDEKIHQMIDQIKAGNHKAMGKEMREAFTVLPDADKADFVLTYNYVRILSVVGTVAEIMGEEAPDIDTDSTSHLSIAGWGGENRARFDLALPKQHVKELVGVFSALGQAEKNRN